MTTIILKLDINNWTLIKDLDKEKLSFLPNNKINFILL